MLREMHRPDRTPRLRIAAATLAAIGVLVLALASSPIAVGSAGSGSCSRAAARAVIREHPHLHPFAPIFTAAGPVLCGPFLGRGEAMIVSFRAATCGGTFGWAAFRWHGGKWNLVWHYRNGQRTIAAVGTEIEETLNILRPTDPRCVPTGGTKSRLWRWNGHKFTPGPWSYQYVNPEEFQSPDGHVTCYMSEAEASCYGSQSRGAGPQYKATVTAGGAVGTCAVQAPSLREVCFQNWAPDLPVLPIGQQSELFGFRCESAADGITCTKLTSPGKDRGFRVSGGEAVVVSG